MSVIVELPSAIEERLRRENPNLDSEAAEACVIELFRQGRLSHFELSAVLGMDRIETDAVLKRHGVEERSLTGDDVDADRATLREVLDSPR